MDQAEADWVGHVGEYDWNSPGVLFTGREDGRGSPRRSHLLQLRQPYLPRTASGSDRSLQVVINSNISAICPPILRTRSVCCPCATTGQATAPLARPVNSGASRLPPSRHHSGSGDYFNRMNRSAVTTRPFRSGSKGVLKAQKLFLRCRHRPTGTVMSVSRHNLSSAPPHSHIPGT